ncbi:MAG TPA: 4Fe-4S dicluster domain-containing protein [Thermodesulfovibrionales bacterium]|nr:4Fe-4S dicluster domain-containing protein [Thermodesulfovibrionales bacterium]
MAIRNIIEIDEEKCNGCGQCIVDCAEAALQIVNGKAKLVKEIYCDGLGACIGGCPTGALRIVQREADPFDEKATEIHVDKIKTPKEELSGCPGTRAVDFSQKAETDVSKDEGDTKPQLMNWPIQLKLVPTNAPFLKDGDLLLAADCAAFSTINVHSRFIRGKILLIACPKLDDSKYYYEKLTELFKVNSVKSITILRMEVPCCGGLAYLVKEALKASGKDIPYKEVVVGIKGEILSEGKTPNAPKMERA